MKIITTLFAVALCHAQTPVITTPNGPSLKTFSDARITVTIYEDPQGTDGGSGRHFLMPVIHTKEIGDGAIVTILYRHEANLQGKKVDLMSAKTVNCPLYQDMGNVCDEIYGLRLSDIAWVRVKLVKTLGEFEIGRKAETKSEAKQQ